PLEGLRQRRRMAGIRECDGRTCQQDFWRRSVMSVRPDMRKMASFGRFFSLLQEEQTPYVGGATRARAVSRAAALGRMLLLARAAWFRSVMFLVVLNLFPSRLCCAQTSQFLFDANGNLGVQTAETIAPPQILR